MPFSMRFRCTRMRNVPSTLLFLPVAANADITHHVSPMRLWLAIFWSKGGPSTRGSRSGAPGRRMRPSSAQGEKASLPSEAMAHTPCQTGRFRFDRSTFRCRDMRAHLFSGIEPPTPHLQAVESSNTENVCEHGELSETATSLSGIRPKEVPLATVAGASGCWYSRHVDYSSTKKRYYSTGGKLRI